MLPNAQTLIIPIEVTAWVANDKMFSKNFYLKRWQNNFQNLNEGTTSEREPFNTKIREAALDKSYGIHIHWSLPIGLRHGSIRQFDIFIVTSKEEINAVQDPSDNCIYLIGDAGSNRKEVVIIKNNKALETDFKRITFSDPDLILLHSFLPAGKSKGKITKNENNNVFLNNLIDVIMKGAGVPLTIEFPLVPNRWLITRLIKNQKAAAWMVESDYVGLNGTTNYPFSSNSKPSANEKNRIGLCTPIEKEFKYSNQSQDMFLTAMGTGDITFATFQPYNENVFSFFDPYTEKVEPKKNSLWDIKKDTADLSYMVIGWYSNPALDPLFLAQKAQPDWASVLNTLQLDSSERKAKQMICHGLVCGVKWNFYDPPSKPDLKLERCTLAAGNNAIEALTSIVTDPTAVVSKKIPKILMDALRLSRLTTMEDLDGDFKIAMKAHEEEFGSSPGGVEWTLVLQKEKADCKEMKDDSKNPIFDLSKRAHQLLTELNTEQHSFELIERQLKFHQGQFYAEWLNAKRQPQDQFKTQHKQAIQDLNKDILTQKKVLTNKKDDLQKEISKTGYYLKIKNKERFWNPQDPVVLLSGAQSKLRLEPEKVKCRYLDELITRIYEDSGQKKEYKTESAAPQNINEIISLIQTNVVFDPTLLMHEFILLHALHTDGESILRTILSESSSKDNTYGLSHFSSKSPYYGIKLWSQPWEPLFIEWEVNWWPLLFNKYWKFNKESNPNQYRVSVEKLEAEEKFECKTISGRSLLTPQATFAFKGQIKNLFKKDPQLAGILSAEQGPQLKQSVIDNWDILTLTLSGFNDRLNNCDTRPHIIPHIDDPKEVVDAKLINGEYHFVPCDSSHKLFNPELTRQGQFVFTRLSLIDKFGQGVDIIGEGARDSQSITIRKSINFDPEATVQKEKRGTVMQLTPKINHLARIRSFWLDSQLVSDERVNLLVATPTSQFLSKFTNIISTNPNSNPICAWLIPNYLNKSLQFFDNKGEAVGEIRLISKTSYQWEDAPRDSRSRALAETHPVLNAFIGGLSTSKDKKNFITQRIDALFNIFDHAFTFTPLSVDKSSTVAAILGRPLALSLAKWELELELPVTCEIAGVSFPVNLGSPDLSQDGLVGYFKENDYSKFFSIYPSGEAKEEDPYIGYSGKENNFIMLQPCFPESGKTKPVYTTLLHDPFAKIHAFSDIVPALTVELPERFYSKVLHRLNFTFRMNSLLTPRLQLSKKSCEFDLYLLYKDPTEEDLQSNDTKFENTFIFVNHREASNVKVLLYYIKGGLKDLIPLAAAEEKIITDLGKVDPTTSLQTQLPKAKIQQLWEIIAVKKIPFHMQMPKLIGAGEWSWLDGPPQSLVMTRIAQVDKWARLSSNQSVEIVDGYLNFKPAAVKKSEAQSIGFFGATAAAMISGSGDSSSCSASSSSSTHSINAMALSSSSASYSSFSSS